ncbi:MAG: glycine oxidase ThiO [Planctomycetes bacterium]|nr:glycine oxidase ThiO [Planctomycetota bacterium]
MTQQNRARDVIVTGGGVIGLSIAWELARHGIQVRVLEQGSFGQEASWAGAGMLPPGNPDVAQTAEARLRAASHQLWPEWTQRLRDQTGIDNGFHRCGGVEVRLPGSLESLEEKIAVWRAEGVIAVPLNSSELFHRIPVLNPEITDGYLLPELGQVRNPRHLKALYQACVQAGVDLRAGSPVIDFTWSGERVTAVKTLAEEHRADEVIVAGGAWSRNLMQRAGHDQLFEPVRGQIVLLETQSSLFRHVIEVGARYLVPRLDGRVLVGSTEERVGFQKRTTATGIAGLIEFARQLVPALGDARVERCWAGLRPYAPGGLPRIGRVPGTANLILAAGHFRAGLQLSPMTAVLIRELILGQSSHEWAGELAPL